MLKVLVENGLKNESTTTETIKKCIKSFNMLDNEKHSDEVDELFSE